MLWGILLILAFFVLVWWWASAALKEDPRVSLKIGCRFCGAVEGKCEVTVNEWRAFADDFGRRHQRCLEMTGP